MSAPAARRPISGLQREVLNLYKRAIKMTRTKPEASQPSFLLLTRWSFRHPKLTSRDVAAIEYQIRKGTKTLETYTSPSIRKVNTTAEMRTWWEAEVEKGRTRAKQEPESEGGVSS